MPFAMRKLTPCEPPAHCPGNRLGSINPARSTTRYATSFCLRSTPEAMDDAAASCAAPSERCALSTSAEVIVSPRTQNTDGVGHRRRVQRDGLQVRVLCRLGSSDLICPLGARRTGRRLESL